MYICVDFDGTIVEHEFPNIGAPVPGALTWIKRWQALGAKVILWTIRSDDPKEESFVLQEAVQYLSDNGIQLFGINENPTQDWSSSPKAYGHIYVDDAAIGCPLTHPTDGGRPYVDWSKVGPEVEAALIRK